jgi:hypothetical protein
VDASGAEGATGLRQSSHKYSEDITTVLIIDLCLWILYSG